MVSGGLGFAGTHLCRHIEAEGHEAISLDLAGEAALACDIRDPDVVEKAIGSVRPDGIFHLAGIAFVPTAGADPGLARAVNVDGTRHILDAADKVGARTLTVSSGNVYGFSRTDEELPVTEDLVPAPADEYSRTKFEAERESLARNGRQDLVIARPFNHTGPGQSPDFVCSDFADQVARREAAGDSSPLRVGDLRAERDFSDVRDVVRAYWMLWNDGTAGQAYNICSGRTVAISEVLEKLLAMARIELSAEVEKARLRPGEVSRLYGSYAKLAEATGWQPECSLDRTLAELLDDRRSRAAS